MKSIILCAGYATRLYPLTKNFPKPLLEVVGETILDRLLLDLEKNPDITEHIIVSNAKFFPNFEVWRAKVSSKYTKKITILNDGSTKNENRLGAVKDIMFAIEKCGIDDDVFVAAGDNVLDFELLPFFAYQKQKNTAVIMRHEEKRIKKLQKTGVIKIDENEKVVLMQEKPENPASNWAVPPFYIYPKNDLSKFARGIEAGCSTDAPGDFVAWFCNNHDVHAWLMTGKRYDVGDLASFEDVKARFGKNH